MEKKKQRKEIPCTRYQVPVVVLDSKQVSRRGCVRPFSTHRVATAAAVIHKKKTHTHRTHTPQQSAKHRFCQYVHFLSKSLFSKNFLPPQSFSGKKAQKAYRTCLTCCVPVIQPTTTRNGQMTFSFFSTTYQGVYVWVFYLVCLGCCAPVSMKSASESVELRKLPCQRFELGVQARIVEERTLSDRARGSWHLLLRHH